MKIFIDSGHNYSGCDTGAVGNGLREQDISFMIADKLKTLFLNDGYEVKMSRNALEENIGKTTAESLKKRCEMSNEWGADLFLSIHLNAGGGKGTETLIYSKSGAAYETAQKVLSAIAAKLSMENRGVKERAELYVLKHTKAPAVLIETGFIDNVADAQKLAYRSADFAEAIYEGVTGKMAEKELTEVNDIVWELSCRGIISDKDLWLKKLTEDKNSYYLAKKSVNYMRGRNV